MADWEEKLNAILGNPQAMGQIAALAQSLQAGPERPERPEPGRADSSTKAGYGPVSQSPDRPEPGRAYSGTKAGRGPEGLSPDQNPEGSQPVFGPEDGQPVFGPEDDTGGLNGEGQSPGQGGWQSLAGPEEEGQAAPDLPDGLGALGALGNLDPRLIQTALELLSVYNGTDDRRAALLAALKPFLKPERQRKMDRAIQIAKLSRVIRVAFERFKPQEDDGHV